MIGMKALAMVGGSALSLAYGAYLSVVSAPAPPWYAGWHCSSPKDLHELHKAEHDLTGKAFWDKRQELTACFQEGINVRDPEHIGYDIVGDKSYDVYRVTDDDVNDRPGRVWFTSELRKE